MFSIQVYETALEASVPCGRRTSCFVPLIWTGRLSFAMPFSEDRSLDRLCWLIPVPNGAHKDKRMSQSGPLPVTPPIAEGGNRILRSASIREHCDESHGPTRKTHMCHIYPRQYPSATFGFQHPDEQELGNRHSGTDYMLRYHFRKDSAVYNNKTSPLLGLSSMFSSFGQVACGVYEVPCSDSAKNDGMPDI